MCGFHVDFVSAGRYKRLSVAIGGACDRSVHAAANVFRLKPDANWLGLVALSVGALLFGGCVDTASEPPSATSTQPPTETSVPPPQTTPSEPEYAGLLEYRRRCEQISVKGAQARVIFEPRRSMTRGDTDTVVAAVTLNQTTPPDQILDRAGATEKGGVLVSCQVQARLMHSPHEFEVEPEDWVGRTNLVHGDTSEWSWYVTPKVGGTNVLVLEVRPFVTTRSQDTTQPSVLEAESDVEQYTTRVQVDVSWTERPQETMSRLAATFNVAEGLVRALTLFLVAVLSLAAVLGIRRHKKKSAGS